MFIRDTFVQVLISSARMTVSGLLLLIPNESLKNIDLANLSVVIKQ